MKSFFYLQVDGLFRKKAFSFQLRPSFIKSAGNGLFSLADAERAFAVAAAIFGGKVARFTLRRVFGLSFTLRIVSVGGTVEKTTDF